jgi:GAF domain-containing protein
MGQMNVLPDPLAMAALSFQPEQSTMLQSIVETARAVYAARASTIFLLSADRSVLTFEAVAGGGEGSLTGTQVSADRGIVGWVLTSGQPIAVDDVTSDPLFDREFAESTRYIPASIIAAPVMSDGDPVGVIEVLDHTSVGRGALTELELLAQLAKQAAVAVQLVRRARAAQALGKRAGGDYLQIARLIEIVDTLDSGQRAAAGRLLATIAELVSPH